MQVQNKLQLVDVAAARRVQSAGCHGLEILLRLPDGRRLRLDGRQACSSVDLADYVDSTLNDTLKRIEGVGETELFGSGYAMRIWLDPDKLAKYALMPSDVATAIKAQNTQVSAGQLGGLPAVPGQQLNATRHGAQPPADARAVPQHHPEERDRRLAGAARRRRPRRAGRRELHHQRPLQRHAGRRPRGQPRDRRQRHQHGRGASRPPSTDCPSTFPQGVEVVYPYDTTPFVRLSIEEVVKTLIEAIVLVFIVMFVFLQNIRATLIPTLAVPVVLLGTFGVLAVVGYSINTLTMFAMVLAIGLLVDDAIVVVENVERVMQEEGLSPKEATEQVDGRDHRRADRHRHRCCRPCSCRWRSSAARSASSTGSSRSPSSRPWSCR